MKKWVGLAKQKWQSSSSIAPDLSLSLSLLAPFHFLCWTDLFLRQTKTHLPISPQSQSILCSLSLSSPSFCELGVVGYNEWVKKRFLAHWSTPPHFQLWVLSSLFWTFIGATFLGKKIISSSDFCCLFMVIDWWLVIAIEMSMQDLVDCLSSESLIQICHQNGITWL